MGMDGWVSRFVGSSEIRAVCRQRVDAIVVSAIRTTRGATGVGIPVFAHSSVLLVYRYKFSFHSEAPTLC